MKAVLFEFTAITLLYISLTPSGAAINIVVSLILVNYIGIAGVLLGSVVGALLTSIWVDPYMVYKYYFKKNVFTHLLTVLFNLVVTLIIGGITWFACSFLVGNSVLIFLLKLGICLILPNILFFLFYFRFPEFKETLITFKDLFKGLKKKKNRKSDLKIT